MNDATPGVRLATPADADAVADTLAAAFLDYAWSRWAVPEDDRIGRLRGLHALSSGLLGIAMGTVWVTDDVSAAALWFPPERRVVPPGIHERLAAEEPVLLGDRLDAVDALDALTRAARPSEPHWYLGSVGTRPDRQGQGLGSLVLAPVLRTCDQERRLAALETSSEANLRFYRRLGFEVTTEHQAPDGALTVWVMVREPVRPL
jgi:GNAT superfamily N-acetyltransferase